MAAISLYEHQEKAIQQMKNGCILCGELSDPPREIYILLYEKH